MLRRLPMLLLVSMPVMAAAEVPGAGPARSNTGLVTARTSVTSILPRGCVSPGAPVTLIGSGLSARHVQAVHLSGTRERWAPPILKQSDTRLVFELPSTSSSSAGDTLRIILSPAGVRQNPERASSLQVCTTTAAPQRLTQPAVSQAAPAKSTAAPVQRTVAAQEPVAQPSDNRQSAAEPRPSLREETLAAKGFTPSGASLPAQYEERPASRPERHQPGELVVFTQTLRQATGLERLAAAFGGRVASRIELRQLGYVLTTLRFPPDAPLDEVMREIKEQGETAIPALNHRYALAGFPSEHEKSAAVRMIGWSQVGSACPQTPRVGMVDSALDRRSPSLEKAHITSRSFLPLGVQAAPPEHGTAVASLLVGSEEVQGLLPAAQLFAAEVFRQDARARFATAEDVLRALDWLLDSRVHAINLSLTGPDNPLIELAVAKVLAGGVPVVAAVGNDGNCSRPTYPAAYPAVLGVTAVDVNRRRYAQANCGPHVALAAPGVDIWAADGAGSAAFHTGTSFAAPYVTAAAALLRHRFPDRALRELSESLFGGALDLGDTGRDMHFGWGLLQTERLCGA